MTTNSTRPFDVTRCVGMTRDARFCHRPATTERTSPSGQVLDVCGTHGIAYDETAFGHGREAATVRVLTGRRP